MKDREAFEELADSFEMDLKEKGYLPSDIATLAYFLLQNNINQMEALERQFKNTTELLHRVDVILNEE